jgi:hypothetical protein
VDLDQRLLQVTSQPPSRPPGQLLLPDMHRVFGCCAGRLCLRS